MSAHWHWQELTSGRSFRCEYELALHTWGLVEYREISSEWLIIFSTAIVLAGVLEIGTQVHASLLERIQREIATRN